MARTFEGQNIVVTGGSRGIGASLVRAFAEQGASLWVLDLDPPVDVMPDRCQFLPCDVSDADSLEKVLDHITEDAGHVDIYVSNAGVLSTQPTHAGSASNADWARSWAVNVMATVTASRVLLPQMIARGSGYFVVVASAAGLLNQIGDAAYSATKHAAVSFAESLAITHGDDGVGVTVACPQYVATGLIDLVEDDAQDVPSLLTAADVADCIITAVVERRFLALPHPQVTDYAQMRARDHDGWVKGMRGLRRRALDRFGRVEARDFYKLV